MTNTEKSQPNPHIWILNGFKNKVINKPQSILHPLTYPQCLEMLDSSFWMNNGKDFTSQHELHTNTERLDRFVCLPAGPGFPPGGSSGFFAFPGPPHYRGDWRGAFAHLCASCIHTRVKSTVQPGPNHNSLCLGNLQTPQL